MVPDGEFFSPHVGKVLAHRQRTITLVAVTDGTTPIVGDRRWIGKDERRCGRIAVVAAGP